MKSLIISLLYPLPENTGGRMRTMNFARCLKKYGDVDLLYLMPESKTLNASNLFQNEFCIAPNDNNSKYSGIRCSDFVINTKDRIKRLIEKRPYIITEWSPESINSMNSTIENENYDVILCRYINNSYPLFKLSGKYKKRVIIDFDDFYSESYLSNKIYNISNSYKKIKQAIQNLLIIRYQKKCLNFGAALFCSNTDLELVSKYRSNNKYIVPNTYPSHITYFPENDVGYGNINTLLFIGTLNYDPNTIGIKWFIDSIFPYLKKENQNIKLLIVGRQPTDEIRQLCTMIPEIDLHADAIDILPFYRKCGVVVVPILSGGGTRIKILEAGMASRPVLSTPFGAYGLDVTDGNDIMLFENRETFIEKYNILKEKDKYNMIAYNMKKNIEEKYSQNAFNKAMGKVISKTIN
jgi:glycosyltransferase involved in cell wall biosynthesis